MMSDPYVLNLLRYIGAILVGALAAGLGALVVQLSGTDPIIWRPILAATLGPIVTGLIARQLTRAGSEELAAQVSAYKSIGYHRDELAVVPQGGTLATTNVLSTITAMNPDDLARVRDATMARHEALSTQPEGIRG